MNNLFRKPASAELPDAQGKYEKFNLSENPFPSNPFVNQESTDKRINGDVYEGEIRREEYEQIRDYFLTAPQANPNHLRLGYIIDESFIGRGNGKSAFLVNLQQAINREYCLDISNEINKCFAIYVAPEQGGRTKTFTNFVDLIFLAIQRSNVIEHCLTVLKLEAISALHPNNPILVGDAEEATITAFLNDPNWYKENRIGTREISEYISHNRHFQQLPLNFPLFKGRGRLFVDQELVLKSDFVEYYNMYARRGKEQLDFIFTHLIQFFRAAGFNGAYILVDDFERIPDFQSARQKRDFALELRTCLFDGLYTSAKIGFYDIILVLHAGVQRLISDAWAESGMENRAPISPQTISHHVIPFAKLSKDRTKLLVRKYLSEYRINANTSQSDIYPFTEDALSKIGEWSEYNAAKILKLAYELLDKAASEEGRSVIDEGFLMDEKGSSIGDVDKNVPRIQDVIPADLIKKAQDEVS